VQAGFSLVKAARLQALIPRVTDRVRKRYRRCVLLSASSACSRTSGRSLRSACGLDRVRLHADLTILAKLAARSVEREPFPSRLGRFSSDQLGRGAFTVGLLGASAPRSDDSRHSAIYWWRCHRKDAEICSKQHHLTSAVALR
jgi:hypothetical protein